MGAPLLLLEQVVERRARATGAQRRGSGSLFLARHANLVECAVVANVLLCDSHWNGLHTLEPAARIEIGALLAGVQFESALGTLLVRRRWQYRPALRAA